MPFSAEASKAEVARIKAEQSAFIDAAAKCQKNSEQDIKSDLQRGNIDEMNPDKHRILYLSSIEYMAEEKQALETVASWHVEKA